MCGISGTFGLANRKIITAMTDAIAHRGPDDKGIYLDETGPVALGHRRLSIIDLSPAGHQPMPYLNQRYWIVYNGEVYNYQDIRVQLESKDYVFKSATDTEVILAAYAEWGASCLELLRGMFAFAIWDNQRRELFLARDRFGIKPLYYAQVGQVFLFTSEIKAILASGLISRQVDYQALWDYLSLGSVPQPRTLLAQVKALLPGHSMTVAADGSISFSHYWDIAQNSSLTFPQAQNLSGPEAAQILRQLLNESTRLHMIADVPVGAFLSGGIDSTAVVGLMSQYVTHPLKTYSIGFETQHTHLSELKWAKLAADRFQTDHTEVILTGEDVARYYDDLIVAIDQPSLDGTNSYFVSKATRETVTVALSGLGGDELLAGYSHFFRFKRAELWRRNKFLTRGAILGGKLSFLPQRYRRELAFIAAPPLAQHAAIRCLAAEEKKRQITNQTIINSNTFRSLPGLYTSWLKPDLDIAAQVSYIELNGYLANTLLRDADAMSMAHALEVRPVLLDHILAEFVFALPAYYKLNGRRTKIIFLEALQDLLPKPIITRPKMGFEMPLVDWLTGPLNKRAQAALNSSFAITIFSSEYLSRVRSGLEVGEADLQLWAYMVLLEWLERHNCEL